jgi:hypothetical protein
LDSKLYLVNNTEIPNAVAVSQITFHCPGDKCPTVDISKALRRICFFGLPFPALLLSPLLAIFKANLESQEAFNTGTLMLLMCERLSFYASLCFSGPQRLGVPFSDKSDTQRFRHSGQQLLNNGLPQNGSFADDCRDSDPKTPQTTAD